MGQSPDTSYSVGSGASNVRREVVPAACAALRRELDGWLARIRFDDIEPDAPSPTLDPRRSYIRLPGGADSEAWLINWPAGSSAPLHDHGDARGIAAVLTGELAELRFSRDSQRWIECRWQPGAIIELAPRTCHEVHNVSERTAYSVHVYAPRLDSMTYYKRTADGRVHALRREAADQW